MTDKQIIINKMDKSKRYCEGIDCAWCNEKEPCIYKITNELEEKLLRKEQECEELKEEIKTNGFGCFNIEMSEQLDQLKQILIEIKPIFELYANSKISEEQLDGTYKIIVKESKVLGDTYITFDPRPAKQALQKISECGANND